MNTTIYLKKEEQIILGNINPFTYLEGVAPQNLFAKAMYPYYAYYSKKEVTIETIPDTSSIKEKPLTVPDNEVCIILVEGSLKRFFLQTFKNASGKFFYLDSALATKDNESTWKVIEDGIDLHTTKKVHFLYPHFSKLIHAYRIKTIYGKEVVDITY